MKPEEMTNAQQLTLQSIIQKIEARANVVTLKEVETSGHRAIVTIHYQQSSYVLGEHCSIFTIGSLGGLISDRQVY